MSVHALPHGEGASAVGEGALELEQFEMCGADVMLQVEGGGEIGLAVLARANQDRLMGGMEALVSAKHVRLLKLLLALFACECDWMFSRDVLL